MHTRAAASCSHGNVAYVPEKNPFSGTGTTTTFDGRRRVKTAVDDAQVRPIAGNGPGDHALAAIEPLESGGAVLTELARAIEHDLATPDHAPATERAYAHDWADFVAFCGRHGLAPLPAAPQTLALYVKALETQRSRSPAGLAAGAVGLSLPTLRRRRCAADSPRSQADTQQPDSRRRLSTRSCADSSADTAAPKERPCGRRSRCLSSSCRQS